MAASLYSKEQSACCSSYSTSHICNIFPFNNFAKKISPACLWQRLVVKPVYWSRCRGTDVAKQTLAQGISISPYYQCILINTAQIPEPVPEY